VLDAIFEENGDKFRTDCVDLLLKVLKFSCTSSSPTAAEDGDNHIWLVDGHMSDRRLKHLLRILPASRHLEAKPTGTIISTGTKRTNEGGSLDEDGVIFVVFEKCYLL